jgi:hypothetical protein
MDCALRKRPPNGACRSGVQAEKCKEAIEVVEISPRFASTSAGTVTVFG